MGNCRAWKDEQNFKLKAESVETRADHSWGREGPKAVIIPSSSASSSSFWRIIHPLCIKLAFFYPSNPPFPTTHHALSPIGFPLFTSANGTESHAPTKPTPFRPLSLPFTSPARISPAPFPIPFSACPTSKFSTSPTTNSSVNSLRICSRPPPLRYCI